MKQLEFQHAAQKKLVDRRAMELQAQHPQLVEANPGPQTTAELRGKSGGAAGLARVIGAGKKGKKTVAEKRQELSPGFNQGSLLAAHLAKLHGGAFVGEFLRGLQSHSAAEVPTGAVAPMAIGSAPSAPESFRNQNPPQFSTSPDYESEQAIGSGTTGGSTCGGAKKSSGRGQKISMLMKSKGMTLGQASKYLKEHPDA